MKRLALAPLRLPFAVLVGLALTLAIQAQAQASSKASTRPSITAPAAASNVISDVTATSQKCSLLWTSNSAGSIDVCWTWNPSADGVNYYGSFWGYFYDHATDGRWVILQATWTGSGWHAIRTAANGGTFSGDYSGLRNLTFRACLTGGYCGSAAR
jgi:hypothetical protein